MMDFRDMLAALLRDWSFKKKSTLGPIAGAVAVFWIVSRLRTYIAANSNSSKLPSPRFALPYFGHIFHLGRDVVETISQWHEQYGPIILMHAGVRPVVIIADPFIAHEILGAKGSQTANRPYNKMITKIYSRNGRGIVAADINTKLWKKTHNIASIIFGSSSINKRLPDMSNDTEKLVNLLATGNNVDPYQHLLRFSLDYVTSSCFGKRTTSINDPLFKNAKHMAEYVTELTKIKYMASGYLPALSFIDYLLGLEKAVAKHTEARDTWILEAMMEAYEDGKECLATALMDAVHAGEIDEITAIVALADIIGGGMNAPAVAMAWAFGILSVKAEVQHKIQKELDHFIETHKRMPTFNDRDQFPYMIAVQKECMRFRPTTSIGLPHEAAEDIVWKNKIIPKGAMIVTNMAGMHMNPDVYSEPHVFRPERFLDKTETFTASAKSNIENRDQYNFGWGRRLCPGIYVAEVHLFNVYTHVFAKYTIEPRVDREGCPPVPLDLESFIPRRDDTAIETAPPPYQVRFVRRVF